MAVDVPYEALGIPPDMAEYVGSPDLGPLGLSSSIATNILLRPHSSDLAVALRDLAFDTPHQQGRPVEELDDYARACLARYCGALAERLGLGLHPLAGEQNG